MRTLTLSCLTLAFAAFGLGCEVAENIDEATDCRRVCNRYAECFDSDYDVSACVDRCTEGNDDGNVADECESCVDGLSCTESFTCTAECANVVP